MQNETLKKGIYKQYIKKDEYIFVIHNIYQEENEKMIEGITYPSRGISFEWCLSLNLASQELFHSNFKSKAEYIGALGDYPEYLI